MVDKDFIKTKIELIQRDLERLAEFRDFTLDQIAGNFYKWSTLKLLLVEIIGRAIDVNAHIIAETGNLKEAAPVSSHATFTRLGAMGILPSDFAAEIANSAGFRNRVVHEYNNLLHNKVYETVAEALDQYTRYCGYILAYLDRGTS